MYIRSPVGSDYSITSRFARLRKPFIWFLMGGLSYHLLLWGTSTFTLVDQPSGQAQKVLHSDLKVSQEDSHQSPHHSSNELLALQIRLEKVILRLRQTEQEIAVYHELVGIKEVSSVISAHSYVVAELNQAGSDTDAHNARTLCRRVFPTLATAGDEQGGVSVQVGDLVVAQGVLLGEISKLHGQCFTMIPIDSKLSSFEVRLEQSGIRGVAVGLGKDALQYKTQLDMIKVAGGLPSMELKYLERSRSALIGERAVLVRSKNPLSDHSNTLSILPLRWPSFVVGDVVEATLDENGLFQSAILASSLPKHTVELVLIVSKDLGSR